MPPRQLPSSRSTWGLSASASPRARAAWRTWSIAAGVGVRKSFALRIGDRALVWYAVTISVTVLAPVAASASSAGPAAGAA